METVNPLDTHGESWRLWVVDNLRRGCNPKSMLEIMTKDVWEPAVAQQAIEAAVVVAIRTFAQKPSRPYISPEPQIALSGVTVDVVARVDRPNAALLGNVLTPAECAKLVAYAVSKGLKSSGVIDNATGDSVQSQARTSSSVFLQRAETPLVAALESRLAQLTNWPLNYAEGIQILRYEPGQQYKAHFDWFDPAKPGSARHLARGGQRVGTTVVYLALPDLGGRTTFPKSGVEVAPTLGGAIFFNSVDPSGVPDPLSLHAGTPVEQGAKVVATYWQRESEW